MSTKFQTLCRKPRSIQLSGSEDMSDYVTEFKKHFDPSFVITDNIRQLRQYST